MGRYLAPFVNFAVNCIETNSIVTFAENYFDSDVRRLIWIWDYRKSDNLRCFRVSRVFFHWLLLWSPIAEEI